MSSPDQPKKRGFMATFAQSISPQPPEGDEAAKAKRPTTVVIALVLATLGGVLFIFQGAMSMLSIGGPQWNEQIDLAREQYAVVTDACTRTVGGVGDIATAAPTPTQPMIVTFAPETVGTAEPSAIVPLCQEWPENEVTQARIDSLANETRIIALVEIAIGLLAIVGAFLMRNGSVPLRRLVLGAVVLSLILSLMVSSSSTAITLIGSLFLVAGMIFTYIGRGGGWFLYQTAARKTQH